MRLAIVVQRFAPDVTGGAEYHARRVGQHLAAAGHEVTVLTSTAGSSTAWDDVYPTGESHDGTLRVLRFQVRPRWERNFERALETLRHIVGRSPVTLHQAWTTWANPFVPALLAYLESDGSSYDAILFFTYYFYPSLAGVLRASTVRIGVPLGHDDEVFATASVRRMLRAFDAILANTEEECELIERSLGGEHRSITVAGCGVDPPPPTIAPPPVPEPYVLYLGRMKDGTEMLAPAFTAFRRRYGAETFERNDGGTFRGDDLVLVTVGDPGFARSFGRERGPFRVVDRVDDATRWAYIAGAEVIVNPSLYESLSLTLLEAWWVGRPVLVREQCRVMAQQIARASGGLSFADPQSFADRLAELLRSRQRRAEMGERGRVYTQSRYAWPMVMAHYQQVLESTVRAR